MPKDHECYWGIRKTPDNVDKSAEEVCTNYYVFDFESKFVQGPVVKRSSAAGRIAIETKKHVVNYVVVRKLFSDEEHTFTSMEAFVEFLDREVKKPRAPQMTMIAHNLKGYDGRLLFTHLVQKVGELPTKIIWAGSKIMSMKVFGKITFQDSLCHIAAPLAQFPAIFGLDETKYKKGFFPYLFNVDENQEYVGPIPALSFFEPNLMSPAKRKEFFEWYSKNKDVQYDFRHELEEYCRSDVRILANALEVYIRDGMALNHNLNPMNAVTIAMYALQIYQTLHMPENLIAYISPAAQMFARRAFSGGRTDVRKMVRFWTKEEVAQGKYGVYQDVQSLYPTVQWYDPMPVGHPTITKYLDADGVTLCPQPNVEYLRTFFGFIECDMTPMQYIHHPVIVEKKDGKLMADLYPKEKVCLSHYEFLMIRLYLPLSNFKRLCVKATLSVKCTRSTCMKSRQTCLVSISQHF